MQIEEENNYNHSSSTSNRRGFFFGKRNSLNPLPKPTNEKRLIIDLQQLKDNPSIQNIIRIISQPTYTLNSTTGIISMEIEFINEFSVQVFFLQDYPYSPPEFVFLQGKMNSSIFNIGNKKIELEKIGKKWSPVLAFKDVILWIGVLIDLSNKCEFTDNIKLFGESNSKDDEINFDENINCIKENSNKVEIDFYIEKRKYRKRKFSEYFSSSASTKEDYEKNCRSIKKWKN